MKRASCGLDVNCPIELHSGLRLASENGFEFVSAPLVHPRFKREFTAKWKDRKGPLTRPDLVLKSNEWNSLIVGKISPYINVDLECLHTQSKCALEQELNYGSHLDVPAFIISLWSSKCHNLARIINSTLSVVKPYQIWIEIPLISHSREASVWRSDITEVEDENTWEWWNTFRTFCNSDKRLGIALKVSKNLPNQNDLDRWAGEPIKCLVISTSVFLTNKKGYPVLSKSHQKFIKSLVNFDVQVIIKGSNHHYSLDCYQKYLNHLWQEGIVQQNSTLQQSTGTNNLAPSSLTDSLVSKSHEIFKDYIKFREYSRAVYEALLNIKSTEVVNIMVVNAGRGPLVFAVLCAAEEANTKVKVYAVENNIHAVVILQTYQEEIWQSSVDIIFNDIKYLNFPQKIDILLSDLLGSFGDNELLPEMLDEAQKFLKIGGITIPESYTSYLCPTQNSKLYSDLIASNNKSDFEIPHVVVEKSGYVISQSKPLFSFSHPNYDNPIGNYRHKAQTFSVEQNCTLHGFTGFLEAVLYKNVKLSTLPETLTPGVVSLPPIFFPLLEPVHLKGGDQIEVHFWRVVGLTKVWYEWTLAKPIPMQIHNPNGRSSNKVLE